MSDSRVIVALDFADTAEALAFASRVQPAECRLKVGLELYTLAGPSVVAALTERGFDVFLDLKYHDIPNTVARACFTAANLGVWMLNVHALGGSRMLEAARTAVDRALHRPLLIGVTILTSHADEEVGQIGLRGDAAAEALRLAESVQAAGLDGVVCASTEAAGLRERFGAHFKLVTPGIRPVGADPDDQRRTLTPIEAVRAGADYLVIGRPVTRAAEPLQVLRSIREQLASQP